MIANKFGIIFCFAEAGLPVFLSIIFNSINLLPKLRSENASLKMKMENKKIRLTKGNLLNNAKKIAPGIK